MPKRTRATKITDVRGDKAWLKKSKPSSYAIETRDRNKTFLIVCEGQTEEQYFKSFPVVTASVKPIPLGCSKSTLVDCAKDIASTDSFDEVWCVFDMDIKRDIVGQREDYNNAIEAALNAGYKCAYSNDAFELWFALHYHFYEQQLDRGFYFEKLSNFWNANYEKNGKSLAFSRSIYSRLEDDPQASQIEAIARAKKLNDKYSNEPYHERNQVTLVFQLVEELNKHLKA